MAPLPDDTVEWSNESGDGQFWIRVDIARGSLTQQPGDPAARSIDADAALRLRALAEAVLPEQEELQFRHVTIACTERLEVHVAGRRCTIEIHSGEITEGPPAAVVNFLRALARAG